MKVSKCTKRLSKIAKRHVKMVVGLLISLLCLTGSVAFMILQFGKRHETCAVVLLASVFALTTVGIVWQRKNGPGPGDLSRKIITIVCVVLFIIICAVFRGFHSHRFPAIPDDVTERMKGSMSLTSVSSLLALSLVPMIMRKGVIAVVCAMSVFAIVTMITVHFVLEHEYALIPGPRVTLDMFDPSYNGPPLSATLLKNYGHPDMGNPPPGYNAEWIRPPPLSEYEGNFPPRYCDHHPLEAAMEGVAEYSELDSLEEDHDYTALFPSVFNRIIGWLR